jgi:hypothetical protein
MIMNVVLDFIEPLLQGVQPTRTILNASGSVVTGLAIGPKKGRMGNPRKP